MKPLLENGENGGQFFVDIAQRDTGEDIITLPDETETEPNLDTHTDNQTVNVLTSDDSSSDGHVCTLTEEESKIKPCEIVLRKLSAKDVDLWKPKSVSKQTPVLLDGTKKSMSGATRNKLHNKPAA